MAGHVLLRHNSSRWSLIKIKPVAAYLHNPIIMRYSKGKNVHEMEERAPSTAEEFKRVAERVIEEKAHQGVDSQTTEKAFDASEEATLGDSNLDSVKNKYKEPSKNENFHKSGGD